MKIEDMTNDWILSEIEKIGYIYKLNKVIRYNLKREEILETQSVAEHVFNMLILANYFRDLEDPEKKLDFTKVTKMILMHDLVEIETGDIVMDQKNQNHKQAEEVSVLKVAEKSPEFIENEIVELCKEYDSAETLEARFVKCIDKIEQQFWFGVFCDTEMINIVTNAENKIKNEEKRRALYKKLDFPVIAKFGLAIHELAMKRGMTY